MTSNLSPSLEPEGASEEQLSALVWYGRGVRNLLSTPALVLTFSFLGFGGFARESGIELVHAMFMTLVIWALPSAVVLIGGIASGAGVLTIAAAVTLASVRMMPMMVALVPVLRDKKTPKWQLYGLSHVTAITAWVFGMSRLPSLPRYARVAYYAGFSVSLSLINVGVTGLGFAIAGAVPSVVAAALFLTTPLYFMLTLPSAAHHLSDRLALIFGFGLGPVFALIVPDVDLLATGLVGGVGAYVIGYIRRRGR
ncbi:Predicted branched-chain amino acid permease (azaleucine resistance) [Cohaesibacter sp. ES.047]|uniref:AzlC family ABC transporter permease n=1 Tax=Cohaesibacter sp. ES.047 TaxID=1798205 RepID=UPI000BB8F74B|nr:AzlC family ABC transporter permease [Cohaesibacter sp. ES.047]SNY93922.1 Predicted branched-chain amino acid permease (azaleucine resistance) [Cohaesibacter sp. ES.047]